MNDPAWVTVGLWDFVEVFVKRHNVTSNLVPENSSEPVPMYYNNFEVVDIKEYLSNALIRNFTREVWDSHMIYQRRWGDAPLRYLALQMAFGHQLNRLHYFCDVHYNHQMDLPPSC